jgi:hypothetical protein
MHRAKGSGKFLTFVGWDAETLDGDTAGADRCGGRDR